MKTLAREQDCAELRRRLAQLRAETQPRWGRMSAGQAVCHLADAYRMALGEYLVASRSRLVDRTVFKLLALYTPMPWPKGIPTAPELDQFAGRGTCPEDFAADAASLLALMQRMAGHQGAWPDHPILGPMSRSQWMRWGYLHPDHHLRQFGL